MTAPAEPRALELNAEQFRIVGERLRGIAGITLGAGKEGLVRARLAPRLRALGLASFAEYLERVEADRTGAELARMVDALTTNKTSFFREAEHFGVMRDQLARPRRSEGRLRIWSAGCSSGEEPYTIAMVLRHALGDGCDARVLATDISSRMVARARAAEYPVEALDDVPATFAPRHFERVRDDAGERVRVVQSTRALVTVARLNLMAEWPMRGPFDAIFCRNVMIYFDRDTQERLVQRFASLLAPRGLLFVGHSESLSALRHDLRYVCPAVYQASA